MNSGQPWVFWNWGRRRLESFFCLCTTLPSVYLYGKPWPAMWYCSSSWRQSWACLPSTCVVTCFAGIGMMWMNVQCHIIISSTTSLSLSLKKGIQLVQVLSQKLQASAAVSIYFLYKTSFVVVVALFLYGFKLFLKKNTHSNNVKKLKNYTQKFIKIVSENLQTLHAIIYLFWLEVHNTREFQQKNKLLHIVTEFFFKIKPFLLFFNIAGAVTK